MQIDDILARHRREPAQPRPAPDAPTKPEGYVAFSAKDKVEFLNVRRANAPWRSPMYHLKFDVSYDGPYGTNFTVHFTCYSILVRGRNLQSVILALQNSTATFIEEFDSSRWPKPMDDKAPFIASIDVRMNEDKPSSRETDRMSDSTGASGKVH